MRLAKISLMGLLSAISWIVAWILLNQIIYNGKTLSYFGWPSLAIVSGITFLTFFFLTNKNRIIALVLDAVIVIGYLIVMPRDFYPILAGGIFLIFLFLFEQRFASEEKSRADFSLRRIMSGSIAVIIYPLLFLIGFNIYHHSKQDFAANPEIYYHKLEQTAIKTVPFVIKKFEGLSIDQKQALEQQLAAEAVTKVRQYAEGYQNYFPFLFAIMITGLLWTFAFILRWAAQIVAWIIFRILLLAGFFKLDRVLVEVEKLGI